MTEPMEARPIPGALLSDTRDGMAIDWDVPIEMDDGIVLRADVYRPTSGGAHPVIATYGPYAKGLTFAAGYPHPWARLVAEHPDAIEGSTTRYTAWETVDPEQWVVHGYAVVRIDSRGAGRSPGFIDVWSQREALDYRDAIDWIGTQPWCTGAVGLAGISYYAKNQWQVAALRPTHLAAICPWEGANDFYRDMCRHGGIHSAFIPDWYRRMATIQYGLGSRGQRNAESGLWISGDIDLTDEELAAHRLDLPAAVLAHRHDDDFYAARSAEPENITVPVLSAANWGGLANHQRGNVIAWERAGSQSKYLEFHGGTHWAAFYTRYGRDLMRQFFDQYLKGTGDFAATQPPVSLNVRHADGSFTARAETEWPLARTDWRTLHLNLPDDTLQDVGPVAGSVTIDAFGEPTTLTTAPLGAPLEVTGPLALRITVATSTADADIFATLRAWRVDGNEILFQGANDPQTPLSQGWLRLSQRQLDSSRSTTYRPFHSHVSDDPVEPGTEYEVDVELWCTSIVLPAGSRLGLTLGGTDFDHGLEPYEQGGRVMRGSGPFRHEHPDDRPPSVFDGQITFSSSAATPARLLLPVIG
jgi:uncharacterized protein